MRSGGGVAVSVERRYVRVGRGASPPRRLSPTGGVSGAAPPLDPSPRPRRHLGPGDLEPGVVAEIGIGDGLALAAGDMVEQQAEFGDGAPFVVPGRNPAQISQVVVVQGDDVGEAAEVRRRHLPALIAGDVDPIFARHGLGARIGRMADMPVPRAGGLDDQVEAETFGLGAEGGLGEGGATDVAEADEEDGGHVVLNG